MNFNEIAYNMNRAFNVVIHAEKLRRMSLATAQLIPQLDMQFINHSIPYEYYALEHNHSWNHVVSDLTGDRTVAGIVDAFVAGHEKEVVDLLDRGRIVLIVRDRQIPAYITSRNDVVQL